MAFEVKEKEAAILEGIEQQENRRRRTERALFNPTVPPHKQKKYDKLLGGQIAMGRFNDKQKREKILAKIYKRNSKNANIADAIMRGGVQ